MQSQGFEDNAGDDSIVPSTPTLCVPRRTDGFGEAVSSPHVPSSGRFTFSESQPPVSRAGMKTLFLVSNYHLFWRFNGYMICRCCVDGIRRY